jgi:predicted GNAT superfamily acetyltransferase
MTNQSAKVTRDRSMVIRDLETIEDLGKMEAVEQEVWQLTDRDVTPVTLLVACKEAGAMLIGAFDGDALIGFAFGIPALEHGQVSIHSHMLAVLPQYRDLNLGYKLKLAQRDRALAMGIRHMTWTFDPLQSRNAHFNFAKAGVVSNRYKIDLYGRGSSSVLHQNGTDRLWLTWPLASERVKSRLRGDAREPRSDAPVMVRWSEGGRPEKGDVARAVSQGRAIIEIPANILAMEENDPTLAWEWRLATRWTFTELLKEGFFVADFYRGENSPDAPGSYLLRAGKMEDFVPDF